MKKEALYLIILCTVFTSLGQILLKKGVGGLDISVLSSFLNVYLFFGLVSYLVGALLLLKAFQFGELSIVYPIIATSFVWVSIISPYIFPSDSMNGIKWLGTGVILLSVSLLGWAGTRGGKHG
jgi:drug/metabolite transporter (DMT)-like permease